MKSDQQVPPSDQPSFGEKVRYRIDLFMSWSPAARFIGLFVVSFLLVTLCAVLGMAVSGGDSEIPKDFFEAMWWAMTRVADAGTMGDDSGTLVRMVATMATLSGVMVVALLIGLVSSTIGDKIEELRQGKSPVIDSGHTLILGFGAKVFPILRELREANSNQSRATIVILSDVDKLEVEEEVREQMGDMWTTRVIVRQGSTFSVQDLRKVGAGRARSIIVLAKGDSAAHDESLGHADMDTIKTLLALRRVNGALVKNHAVVELVEGHRSSVLMQLGQGGVEVVAMRETLARLMVQTARQTGLASVYKDLLSYDGSELYFKNFPELDGWRIEDVPPVLKEAVLVGVRQMTDSGAKTVLNPSGTLRLGRDDELLVLAEDDDSFRLEPNTPLKFVDFRPTSVLPPPAKAERILACGYRSDLIEVLAELDKYVLQGAQAVCMAGAKEDTLAQDLAAVKFNHLAVEILKGGPTDPEALRRLPGMNVTAVLLVADDTGDPEEADACTVISLLLLRDLYKDTPDDKKPRVISEILDPRTQELVTADDLTDFVVSSEITSMLLAQVSERRELNAVFGDLFDSDGNEIYLKRISRYAPVGQPVSWMAVQKAARAHGETAIGCFRAGSQPVLNPQQGVPLVFRPTDKLIVIAEDDSEGVQVQRSAA